MLAPYAGWGLTPRAGPVGLRSIHREGACTSQRQAGRGEWAGRAEQAGPRGCNWILLGHAEPIDPVVIKVAPKPDSYSTLGGRSFSEKHPLFPMVWHRMEQSLARVLPDLDGLCPIGGTMGQRGTIPWLCLGPRQQHPSGSILARVPGTAQPRLQMLIRFSPWGDTNPIAILWILAILSPSA